MDSHHVSAEQLELYLLNRIEPKLVDGIEEHLLVCEQCQEAALLDELTLEAMRLALQGPLGNEYAMALQSASA